LTLSLDSITDESVTLSASVSGATVVKYVWHVNGVEQAASTATLTLATEANTSYSISAKASYDDGGKAKYTNSDTMVITTPKE